MCDTTTKELKAIATEIIKLDEEEKSSDRNYSIYAEDIAELGVKLAKLVLKKEK